MPVRVRTPLLLSPHTLYISKSCWLHHLNEWRICPLCISATAPALVLCHLLCHLLLRLLSLLLLSVLLSVPHMRPEGSCEYLSRSRSSPTQNLPVALPHPMIKAKVPTEPSPQAPTICPCPLSALSSSHIPLHSPCSIHTGLSLFPEQARHRPNSEPLPWLFPLPRMLFPQMSTHLPLSPPIFTHLTFLVRPPLPTLSKTPPPTLPIPFLVLCFSP